MLALAKKLLRRQEKKAQTDRELYAGMIAMAAAAGGDLPDKETPAFEGLAASLGFSAEDVSAHIDAVAKFGPLKAQADGQKASLAERKELKVLLRDYEQQTKDIIQERRSQEAALAQEIDALASRATVAGQAITELEGIQRKFPFLFAPTDDAAWDRQAKRNTRFIALRRGFVDDDANYVFVADLLGGVAAENSGHFRFTRAEGQPVDEFDGALTIIAASRSGVDDAHNEKLELLLAAGVPGDPDADRKRKRAPEEPFKMASEDRNFDGGAEPFAEGSADWIAGREQGWRIRYAVACVKVAQRLGKWPKVSAENGNLKPMTVGEYVQHRLLD